jgi:lysophosphatidylcholine acyltransferase/lyso-PAF acetyltransferase
MLAVSAIRVRCRYANGTTTQCNAAPYIPHGIIVANHIGYVDAMAIVAYFGCSVVAKEEIHHYPILGTLGDALQAIWIKRRDPEDKQRAQAMIVERGQRPECRSLILFPEGTTTNGRSVIQFNKGAFTTDLPVHPVAVRCRFRYFDPSHQQQPLLRHGLALFLCNIYHTIDLDVLDRYEPNGVEKADAVLYARNVQLRIATHLGVPALDVRGKDNPALCKSAVEREPLPEAYPIIGADQL